MKRQQCRIVSRPTGRGDQCTEHHRLMHGNFGPRDGVNHWRAPDRRSGTQHLSPEAPACISQPGRQHARRVLGIDLIEHPLGRVDERCDVRAERGIDHPRRGQAADEVPLKGGIIVHVAKAYRSLDSGGVGVAARGKPAIDQHHQRRVHE